LSPLPLGSGNSFFTSNIDGNTINISAHFSNPFSGYFFTEPAIDVDMSITAETGGISRFSLVRDTFPSMEIISTLNGVITVLRNYPEAQFFGERCLFSCGRQTDNWP
jgi:hypothetical protein